MSGLFLETQVNVVVVTIIAKTRMYSKFSFLTRTKGQSGNRVGAVYKGQGVESNRGGQRCSPSDA